MKIFIVILISYFMFSLTASCQQTECNDFENLSFVLDYFNYEEKKELISYNGIGVYICEEVNNLFINSDKSSKGKEIIEGKLFFFKDNTSFQEMQFEVFKNGYRFPTLPEFLAFGEFCNNIQIQIITIFLYYFDSEVDFMEIAVMGFIDPYSEERRYAVFETPKHEKFDALYYGFLAIKN